MAFIFHHYSLNLTFPFSYTSNQANILCLTYNYLRLMCHQLVNPLKVTVTHGKAWMLQVFTDTESFKEICCSVSCFFFSFLFHDFIFDSQYIGCLCTMCTMCTEDIGVFETVCQNTAILSTVSACNFFDVRHDRLQIILTKIEPIFDLKDKIRIL